MEEGNPAEKLLQSSRQRVDVAWLVVELEEKERQRQAGMCLGGRVIRIVDGLVVGFREQGQSALTSSSKLSHLLGGEARNRHIYKEWEDRGNWEKESGGLI